MTILDKIIENKKKELEVLTVVSSIRDMEKGRLFKRETVWRPFIFQNFCLTGTERGLLLNLKGNPLQRVL